MVVYPRLWICLCNDLIKLKITWKVIFLYFWVIQNIPEMRRARRLNWISMFFTHQRQLTLLHIRTCTYQYPSSLHITFASSLPKSLSQRLPHWPFILIKTVPWLVPESITFSSTTNWILKYVFKILIEWTHLCVGRVMLLLYIYLKINTDPRLSNVSYKIN